MLSFPCQKLTQVEFKPGGPLENRFLWCFPNCALWNPRAPCEHPPEASQVWVRLPARALC